MTGLELLPVAEGVALGLAVARVRPGARRRWAAGVGTPVLGAIAAMASGELHTGAGVGFILLDCALVAATTYATLAGVRRWSGARARTTTQAPR